MLNTQDKKTRLSKCKFNWVVVQFSKNVARKLWAYKKG